MSVDLQERLIVTNILDTKWGGSNLAQKPPEKPLTQENFKRDKDDPIHAIRAQQKAALRKRVEAWDQTTSGHNRRLDKYLLAHLRAAGPVVIKSESAREKLPTPPLSGFA